MKNYSYIGDEINGIRRVKLVGYFGFIDINGDEICPIKYSYAWPFNNGFANVRLDNKWGFINERGEEIIEIKYDPAESKNRLDQYIKNHNRNLKLNLII
jgi:hypothetical protein